MLTISIGLLIVACLLVMIVLLWMISARLGVYRDTGDNPARVDPHTVGENYKNWES